MKGSWEKSVTSFVPTPRDSVRAQSSSRVSLFATPCPVALQASLVHRIPRQGKRQNSVEKRAGTMV